MGAGLSTKLQLRVAYLWALVVCLLAAGPANSDELVASIQNSLAAYGYDPGPADGVLGRRTAEAIEDFQSEFRLPVDGMPSEPLASALGDLAFALGSYSQILVVNLSGDAVGQLLNGLNHAELLSALAELENQSVKKIDTQVDKPKAVVFVVDELLEAGDLVTTQIEVVRLDQPAFVQEYSYRVKADTPSNPMVVVNEVEAGWELQLTHRLFVNGVQVAENRTRAAP